MTEALRPSTRAPAHWPVVAAGLAATVLLVLLSPAFGVTRDEPVQNALGAYVVEYWEGKRPPLPAGPHLHLYGGLFEATTVLAHRAFGGDRWAMRHRVNAAFGGVGVLAIGLFAARLFGTRVGLLTVALTLLSPRFFAHAMNNSKDAPFAALCSVILLSFTLLRTTPPFLTWPRALLVGLALALALNVRAGALIYWGYLGLLVAALHVRASAYSAAALSATAARLAAVTLIMLLAGCLAWPWALENPVVRPFQALLALGDFRWPSRVLFQGHVYNAMHLPASYLPVVMSLTIPPVVLGGAVLSTVAIGSAIRRHAPAAALWFVVLFPIVTAIVKGSTLYSGWRHVLFVYPPLAVLAAFGWSFVWERARSKPLRTAIGTLLVAGCLEPLAFMVRNHPNQVVYYNALIGGPRGAAGRFEFDYWANSYLQGVAWCAELAEKAGVPLAISGTPERVVRFNAERFPAVYYRRRGHGQHHLELRLLRSGVLEDERRVLHVFRLSDGTPIAAVVSGPKYREVRARLEPHLPER